jgi:hypothetical protein
LALSKFPTIPDFNAADPQSVGTSLRAMKDSVEQLTGLRQGASLGAPSMFVQTFAPTAGRQTILTRGDLWINSDTNVMSYWNGSQWKALV